MSKIKFRLEVWETTLLFQVLEMDERFRSYSDFKAHNNIVIRSCARPDINGSDCADDKNEIYLRGIDKEDDTCVVTEFFKSHQEAEEFKSKILSALKDWAENWEGFKDDKPTDINKNVYEF